VREGIKALDMLDEVINCVAIPTDDEGRFRYYARRLTAAATTQAYCYMIQAGLEMGLVSTGEVIIFLKIDWTDPSTLYFHVAEPALETQAQPPEGGAAPYCTAVSQMLAFTVMALLGSGPQGQDARDRAVSSAPTWAEDWESILDGMEATPAARQPPSSGRCWEPRTYVGYDRSPIPFRHPRRVYTPPVEDLPPLRQGPPSDDDDDNHDDSGHGGGCHGGGGNTSHRSVSPSSTRSTERQSSQAGAAAAAPSYHTHSVPLPTLPFCTHACLLGLTQGGTLDPTCPNVALHCQAPFAPLTPSSSPTLEATHLLSLSDFLERLGQQLRTTLDTGIEPLGLHGARGALFRITLLSHGYTLAAKGTTAASVGCLEHEAAVYQRLRPIQGSYVPVLLGAIDLRVLGRRYFYVPDVHIVYFLLLSWAGKDLYETREQTRGVGNRNLLRGHVLRSLQSLHALGVAHGDVRRENLVWSQVPSDPVMIIDFERSVLTQVADNPLFQKDVQAAAAIWV